MTTLNLFSATTINGRTAYSALTTSAANVIVNAVNSNTTYRINDIMISNYSAGVITANVNILRGTTLFNLIGNIGIPANSMLAVVGKDTPFYLEENDALQAFANTASAVTLICSYEYMS
jgi:hypothetical protein